jgi:ribonuclease BN (tRNA processing enzyme)
MTDNVIKVLGTGNSESENRFNNSFIMQNWQGNLLVDCDSEIKEALANQNIPVERIDGIFITRIDVGSLLGLDKIALESLTKNKKKVELFFHKNLYQEILDQTVNTQLNTEKEYILHDFFNINIIENSFEYLSNRFDIFEVEDDLKKHSFGFNMNQKLFYSGTATPIPEIINNQNFIIGIHDIIVDNDSEESLNRVTHSPPYRARLLASSLLRE